jgi:hypothetical protein
VTTRFVWLALSDKPAARDAFALSAESFTGLYAHVTISNQFAIVSTPKGTFVNPDRPSRGARHSVSHWTILVAVLLVAGFPIFLLIWHSLKQQPVKGKEN